MPTRHAFTRREFLQTAAVATLGATIPAFLGRSVQASSRYPLSGPRMTGDRVLVVVQLGGGNDGLNTVVPYADDAYHRARPRLRLRRDGLLALDDYMGLHPSLEPFKELYDNGDLAIVNGVGYPNPDRSHFRSMEIWHTATDSDRYSATGWVGRYLDNQCDGRGNQPSPLAGVSIGPERPQAFAGERGLGVSFQDPARFRWNDGGSEQLQDAFRQINGVGVDTDDDGSAHSFLRHMTANAVVASDHIVRASRQRRAPNADYPNGRLASDLRTIADLIAAGIPTRIFYASFGGFDTHANQPGQHANLLAQVAGAVAAFQRDLRGRGLSGRVATLCFSEFGRRVAENGSGGTDHGAAGPVFVLGDAVKPGLHGKYPSLTDLAAGDLRHAVDFRSVYADLLGGWLGGDCAAVLGRPFAPVGLIERA